MQSMQGDTANYPELNKSHCQPSDNSGLIVSFIYIDSSLWLTFISPFLPNQDSIKLTVKPTALQWSSPREYLPQYDTKYNKLDLMLIGITKEGPLAPTLTPRHHKPPYLLKLFKSCWLSQSGHSTLRTMIGRSCYSAFYLSRDTPPILFHPSSHDKLSLMGVEIDLCYLVSL